MKSSEFILKTLYRFGCNDLFCIPGGVILPLLYAARTSTPEIRCHLNYHEQASGFAACGYSHVSGRLGCAVVTRGPGATNITTAVAEAWQESLPVVFITGHAEIGKSNTRFDHDQELDLSSSFSFFTKKSLRINTLDELLIEFPNICRIAQEGRKGPVYVDIYGSLFDKNLDEAKAENALRSLFNDKGNKLLCKSNVLDEIFSKINNANAPVILIGDGIRFVSYLDRNLIKLLSGLGIPIISSRGSSDISNSLNYFGYVGSHGCRSANCILSKADLVISIGNRLGFPENSQTFRSVYKSELIQVDIDGNELLKHKEWKGLRFLCDAGDFIKQISKRLSIQKKSRFSDWLFACKAIARLLEKTDCGTLIFELSEIMKISALSGCCAFSFDAGNNEFFCSRAYTLVKSYCDGVKVLCSKSFGTLGISLARAIGACIAESKRVVCFTGDQGFQLNIQEIECIVSANLPITIVIINNFSSGMIADAENNRGYPEFLVNVNSGYNVPDFKKILSAYGIPFLRSLKDLKDISGPCFMEIFSTNKEEYLWKIPRGETMDKMCPPLDKETDSKLQAFLNSILK